MFFLKFIHKNFQITSAIRSQMTTWILSFFSISKTCNKNSTNSFIQRNLTKSLRMYSTRSARRLMRNIIFMMNSHYKPSPTFTCIPTFYKSQNQKNRAMETQYSFYPSSRFSSWLLPGSTISICPLLEQWTDPKKSAFEKQWVPSKNN